MLCNFCETAAQQNPARSRPHSLPLMGGGVLLMVVDAPHRIPEGSVPCAVALPRISGALVQQEAERDHVVPPGGQYERGDAVMCVEGRRGGPFAR